MRGLQRIASLVISAALACPSCGDDDSDDDASGCSAESCQALCDEAWAEELDDCGGICELDAYCLTTGECDCNFYPCGDGACLEWCLANTEETQGGCGAVTGNLVSCDCY